MAGDAWFARETGLGAVLGGGGTEAAGVGVVTGVVGGAAGGCCTVDVDPVVDLVDVDGGVWQAMPSRSASRAAR